MCSVEGVLAASTTTGGATGEGITQVKSLTHQFVLIAAAIAALFAVSCVKENPVENAPVQGTMKEVTITATIDEYKDLDGISSAEIPYAFKHLTFLTYKGWTPTGSVPEKYDPMMVVALP